MIKSFASILLASAFTLALMDSARACDALKNIDTADLIRFLAKDKSKAISTNPNCVTYAIMRLGDAKTIEAAPVIADYLDYKRPFTPEEEESIRLHFSMPLREFYPAVTALFQIGKPALPALSNAICKPNISSLALDKAVFTTMLIFREDPTAGIRFLKSNAQASTDPVISARINQAAETAIRWCGSDRRDE